MFAIFKNASNPNEKSKRLSGIYMQVNTVKNQINTIPCISLICAKRRTHGQIARNTQMENV